MGEGALEGDGGRGRPLGLAAHYLPHHLRGKQAWLRPSEALAHHKHEGYEPEDGDSDAGAHHAPGPVRQPVVVSRQRKGVCSCERASDTASMLEIHSPILFSA